MSAAKFLIFLPVRNGGRYVRQAIDSVRAQTHADWRLVVLENASTDDTAATLASYQDDRLSILPANRALGIYANWHRGFQYLVDHGIDDDTLVTFLGHDDYFEPEFLASIAQLAEREPGATLYQTMFDMVDVNGRLIRCCRPIPARETWSELLAALAWAIRDSYGTGNVFRARDYRAVGGIPDLPLLLWSDHLLLVRLTRLGYKACSPSIGFAYRLRQGSTSFSLSPAKVNDQAEALSAYVDAIRADYGEFLAGVVGQSALASLLARELFLLDNPVIRRALSAENRQRTDVLRRLFETVARGVPAQELVGAPASTSRLVLMLRRMNLARNFAFQRYR